MRFRGKRLPKLLLLPVALALLLLWPQGCERLDDLIGEGNRYRDGIAIIRAIDGQTKEPVETFQVKLIYGDRNPSPEFNEVNTTGSGGAATIAFHYPTFGYRRSG